MLLKDLGKRLCCCCCCCHWCWQVTCAFSFSPGGAYAIWELKGCQH